MIGGTAFAMLAILAIGLKLEKLPAVFIVLSAMCWAFDQAR